MGNNEAPASSESLRSGSERLSGIKHQCEAWRSHAQVDIDRLLYSPEFRRLAGVTQVVPPEDEFHFHDRLSHSIKVAQVAATLARMLTHKASDSPTFEAINLSEWVDPDHCYAAALAHDIGHPPFGHAGEAALQRILQMMGEQDEDLWEPEAVPTTGTDADIKARSDGEQLAERSFEGNAQSTRVVAQLSFREKPPSTGLDLTLRTMAAIAKYPWLRGGHPADQDKLANKWSFYAEEADILSRLVKSGFIAVECDPLGTVTQVHRWVEAEIMDWADDISYAVHDIDDFYRARLIPLGQILVTMERAPRNDFNWHDASLEFITDDDIKDVFQFIAAKLKAFQRRSLAAEEATAPQQHAWINEFNQAYRKVTEFAKELARTSDFSGTDVAYSDLRAFSSAVIRYLSDAATLVVNEETQRVQLALDPVGVLVAEFFKALNSYFVIESVNLATMQYGQVVALSMLFESLFDLASEWVGKQAEGKKSGRLPARLRSYLKSIATEGETNPDEGLVAVAVLDYISSLRDAQAAHLATQLIGLRDTSAVAVTWLNN